MSGNGLLTHLSTIVTSTVKSSSSLAVRENVFIYVNLR
jgi:hypothetical protein